MSESQATYLSNARAQLEDLRNKAAILEAEIEEHKESEIVEYVEEIRSVCADMGFEVQDIIQRLTPQEQPKAKRKSNGTKTYWQDSHGRIDKGKGAMPGWMFDAIKAAGQDPSAEGARKAYREANMRRVEA